jgi:hypothetical protein
MVCLKNYATSKTHFIQEQGFFIVTPENPTFSFNFETET